MAHRGSGLFGGRRSTPADALLHDARAAAREEFELHRLLVGSDWQDDAVREMRDRVAMEFSERHSATDPDVIREATNEAERLLARHGTGRLDLRAYQLLAELAGTGAGLA